MLGCVNNPVNYNGSTSQNNQDYMWLLENLDDGKVATWQDSNGGEHHFAVFSTYPENQKLCRDYFHIVVGRSNRNYGTSCRVGKEQWQHVLNSERTAQLHYAEFMQLEQEFNTPSKIQPGKVKTNNFGSRNINYTPSYNLSSFFSKHSTRAESKYGLPLRNMIDDAAQKQNFHSCLVHSVVFHESSYNPSAASGCCVGLMQLGKATASEVGVSNRRNAQQNLNGGTVYLRKKLNERGIDGKISLALASYNCGYGTIKKNNFQIPERCSSNKPREYVNNILKRFKECN